MIQRIQTIWLAISAISCGFLLKGGILNFITNSGEKYYINISGINKITDTGHDLLTNSVLLSLLLGLILVFSIVAIFMFKSRKNQMKYTVLVAGLSLVLLVILTYYSYRIMSIYNAELLPGVKMFLPPVILISAILAYRGIAKDDRLVRSNDRLR